MIYESDMGFIDLVHVDVLCILLAGLLGRIDFLCHFDSFCSIDKCLQVVLVLAIVVCLDLHVVRWGCLSESN